MVRINGQEIELRRTCRRDDGCVCVCVFELLKICIKHDTHRSPRMRVKQQGPRDQHTGMNRHATVEFEKPMPANAAEVTRLHRSRGWMSCGISAGAETQNKVRHENLLG